MEMRDRAIEYLLRENEAAARIARRNKVKPPPGWT